MSDSPVVVTLAVLFGAAFDVGLLLATINRGPAPSVFIPCPSCGKRRGYLRLTLLEPSTGTYRVTGFCRACKKMQWVRDGYKYKLTSLGEWPNARN